MRSRMILGLAAVILVAGCSSDHHSTTAPETSTTGSIEVHMLHQVGNENLEFNQIKYTNAFGNKYSVTTLKYYISSIELRGPDGNVPFDIVHYIDAQDSTTCVFRLDDIPETHYHQLVFTFGLDDEKNSKDKLPPTLENLDMLWPDTWGGGYHYMKLEGHFLDADQNPDGFLTHVGRYQPDPTGPAHSHFFTVSLDLHSNIVRNEVLQVDVIMDVNQWYESPNVIDLATHTNGIMDNTPAQDLLQENGATVFSLEINGQHPQDSSDDG
jgi:hypothetical protein